MDLVSIPAGRAVMANPVPRDRIFQYSPCRGLSTHPRAMNMQLTVQCWWGIHSASFSRQAKVVTLVIAYTILTKTIYKYQSNYVWKNIWAVIDISIWHLCLQKCKILACNFQMYGEKETGTHLTWFQESWGRHLAAGILVNIFIQQRQVNDIIDPYLIQTIILRIYHDYGDGQSFISCPAPLQKLLTNNYNSLQLCALRIMISQIKSRARKQEC